MGSIGGMFTKLRDALLFWPQRKFEAEQPEIRIGVAGFPCPDPKDPAAKPGIMCDPGEYIRCDGPERHIVAVAHERIKIGDPSSRVNEQFVWFQAPPKIGTPMAEIRCQYCDGRWVADGMHLHFKGGWR